MQSKNVIFFVSWRVFFRDTLTTTANNLTDKLQFSGGIINELAVTNLGGYGVSP